MTSQMMARPCSTAVASADGFWPNPPSPTSESTTRSGAAIFAPMAAGGPKPMVANPPGVSTLPGVYTGNCWPTPFLFQPTSVVMIASRGSSARTSARMRSGIIGNASDVAMAWLLGDEVAAEFRRWCLPIFAALASAPETSRARRRISTCSACLRSATAPISVEKFLPISEGSMSMWMRRVGGMLNV